MAETEGFEPSVGVIPLRRFSKPLVSATHPRLRRAPRLWAYIGGISKVQPGETARGGAGFAIPAGAANRALMLSLPFIRDNPDLVRTAIADKGVALDLDALLALDGEVRELKTEADELRRRRNEISDGFKGAAPEARPALGQQAKAIGAEISALEAELSGKQEQLDALLLRVPNIPWEGAPVGPDETANT